MKTEETRKNKKWSRLEDLMLLSCPNTDASVMAQRLDRTEPSIWSRRQLLQGAKKDKTPKARAYRLSLLNELNKGQLEMDLTPPPAPKVPTRVIPIKTERPAVKPISLGAPTINPTQGQRPEWLPPIKKRRSLRARFLAWLQRG